MSNILYIYIPFSPLTIISLSILNDFNSGIMFPIKCKDILPIDHVVINSVAVRGALGALTVWVTKDENLSGEISMSKKFWTKIYEKTHAPSFVAYEELDLSASPVILRPGQVKGIYIHSTRRGECMMITIVLIWLRYVFVCVCVCP